MKSLIAIALAAGVAVAGASAADARDGCGRGFHRGPYGHCRPNHVGGLALNAPVLVVDRYYPGRGYWDGRRYWQHRGRHHDGWRYW
jgi:hypothetical protein